MGDRSNIFIQHRRREDGTWSGVGLYSHWGGERFTARAQQIAAGTVAQSRVGDASYFTRIVFQNLMAESFDPDSATGGGVWVEGPDDNEYPILVINAQTGRSWYTDESGWDRDEDYREAA